ncbi:MAG: ABC transporter permease [Candidatus Lokiarchaeota archaeon]|nr:ABC transporter permease [Candidatus Lokiarchaeota archaeon]
MSDLNLKSININYSGIWVLAKRELLAFWRNKIRIITSFSQAILFLSVFIFSFPSSVISIGGQQIDSKAFIASGIGAMTVLFTGIFGGLGVMKDKMFGFMKELIIAPVSRNTLMLGRTLGIAIQTIIQVFIILLISLAVGFFGYDPNMIWRFLLALPVVLLSCLSIVGLGITIGTRMRDFESFGLIQTFIVMPMFWLSGAMFPLSTSAPVMQVLNRCNPLFYSIDLFRLIILGASYHPFWIDLIVMGVFAISMILLGSYSFKKMEVK